MFDVWDDVMDFGDLESITRCVKRSKTAVRMPGMMPGILEMMEGVAKTKGLEWKDVMKQWKESGQWHVEVY